MIWKKMHLKPGIEASVISAPDGFALEHIQTRVDLSIRTELHKETKFLLVFALNLSDVEEVLVKLNEQQLNTLILWIAYPKKSSKKYQSEIHRDCSWEPLGKRLFEPVSAIAIDEDWSALRFKKRDQIKKLTRNTKMLISR